ncbi:MAG: hypothetical protein J5569_01470 [Oscillospiraceae bacterium]|nr:hypothetical protein [Oscillospiraceae bacterium]
MILLQSVTNYKCPACTGPLRYDEKTGRLACDYCGSSFAVSEIESLYAEKDEQAAAAAAAAAEKEEAAQAAATEEGWDSAEISSDWGKDADVRAYNCPSCGAELIFDVTTAATSCPYCGNPTIVPGNLSGTLKPDYVIPFRLNKEAAVKALREYYQGKKLLPKAFASENHINEVKGVYVPFWMYDGSADTRIHATATRVHTTMTRDERITVTEYYDVYRNGTVSFDRIPVDASKKMPDEYMDALEPYDYSALTKFSNAYLPGYMADKYDVSADECAARADDRASRTAESAVESTISGYASVSMNGHDMRLRRGKVSYALLPVWILNTKWNGNNYMFAMNGQTGKMVGDLPVDKGRYWSWFAGITLAVTAVVAALQFLI